MKTSFNTDSEYPSDPAADPAPPDAKRKAGPDTGMLNKPVPEGRFFSRLNVLRCDLCPRHCLIPSKSRGACGVRGNIGGKSHIPWYGYVTALGRDPIEKKPLYHFRPGSSIFSVGFAGCNLRCPFCQNWRISQLLAGDKPPGRYFEAGDIVALALTDGKGPPESGEFDTFQIAYTYSEPLVHPEYLIDCMRLAHQRGAVNILVTNGCATQEAAAEIIPFVDAVNVDLKSFSRRSYRETLGGDLDTVLDFIAVAYESGVHVEVSTLVVPGFNDREAELKSAAYFIADIEASRRGRVIPWHLNAYHPDWNWDAPPTEPAALLRAAERAREILPYVYAGNIAGEEAKTLCPHCGRTLVSRRAYRIDTGGLVLKEAEEDGEKYYCCASCGKDVPLIVY
ncbi:MAG: AmmeMemoRadiSam system radical SAM enzyme [Treponema sp.]|jgi:pyruvate formate lyase activating enzyme|nr:AmmeMemoRadiSam system radical SAM enzyme [Treponema sp.]